jgi:glycerophosphoryl diester phosphodiesterase
MTDAAGSVFARGERVRPLVYGHRGTRRGLPENTLGAMSLALSQGADGIELDVRLCRTGEVIVLHDRDLVRVASARVTAAEASLAELQVHDLGGGERVPTLDAAIGLVLGAGRLLNIELKADVPEPEFLVQSVAACIAARPALERAHVLVSSFSAEICTELHVALPDVPVALIYEREPSDAWPEGITAAHPRYTLASAAAIARLRRRQWLVNAWTVNDPEPARALAAAGADGIITDDVPRVLAALGGSPAAGEFSPA